MIRAAFFLVAVLLSGCQRGAVKAADFGRELFSDPRLSDSAFNAYACATCHATTAAPSRQFAGHTLVGAASRPTWWGGYETDLLDSVNFCVEAFMRGAPLTRDEPRGKALFEYLKGLAPTAQAEALPLTIVTNVVPIAKGDAARGEVVFRAACLECHGDASTGAGKLTSLAPTLREVAKEYGTLFPGVDSSTVVVEKVRHGQFFHIGGTMPFYGKEALSDADLGALLRYLDL